ncbi:MAG: copper-binding protein [Planctomycetota bacterium]
MPSFSRKTACLLANSAFCLSLIFSTGCSDSTAPSAPSSAESTPSNTKIYVVRGVISNLPTPEKPAAELSIKHEAIPDFVDSEGKTVGMDVMTMPFPVAEGLDLAEFSVDDKVEVTFVVTWGGDNQGWAATELPPLPIDTELDFTPLPKSQDHHNHHDHGHHDHSHGDHSGHQH